jgi:glycogen operon protein
VLAGEGDNDAPLYIVLNGADDEVDLTFPEWAETGRWLCLIDTSDGGVDTYAHPAGAQWKAKPRTVLAFAGTR